MKGKKRSLLFRVIIPFGILLGYLIYKFNSEPDTSWFPIAIISIVGIYFVYWLIQWAAKCPSCLCWSADEVTGKELTDYSDHVTHETETTRENNRFGSDDLFVTKNYQVTSSTTKYKVSHKCKFCNHQWTTNKTESSSNKRRV